MATTIAPASGVIDCAPGETVTIPGVSSPGITSVQVVGAAVKEGAVPAVPTLGAGYNFTPPGPSNLTIVIPDGAQSGGVLVTSSDASSATFMGLRVGSKYVATTEYIGEGMDVTALAAGELDSILRDASEYADVFVGHPLRLLQQIEAHPWRESRRIFPWRYPIASIDALLVRISNTQQATINPPDVVVNESQGYVEILSYAVAAYSFSQAIMNLGLTANIVELTYTAGYPVLLYPAQLRKAVKMIATELLIYRRIQAQGLSGLSSYKGGNQQFDRRSEAFEIPKPAKELLMPFAPRRIH